MSDFGWAVIGPGRIAHRFAEAVTLLPGSRLVAVHGRDAARAAAFAEQWSQRGLARCFDSIQALCRDDAIEGVYIATPHAFHADAVRQCLLAGKPVLCEKPLATDARRARELTALSRERGVFLMEALWTRFLPIYELVGEWLATGMIGRVRGLQSSFGFNVAFDARSRQFDPALAGGALLDIGIYNLSMSQWLLRRAGEADSPLTSLTAHGVLGPTGVDHRVAVTLAFGNGITSQFQCGLDIQAENALRIFGEHGIITVPDRFWEATTATLQVREQPAQAVHRQFRINGFEGEIQEAMQCIARGDIESATMPHADTVTVADWMDRIRAELGVAYPFD